MFQILIAFPKKHTIQILFAFKKYSCSVKNTQTIKNADKTGKHCDIHKMFTQWKVPVPLKNAYKCEKLLT